MPSISRLILTAGLLLVATEALAQPKKIEFSGMIGHQFGAIVDETTKDEGVDSLGQALGALGSATYGLILDYHITRTMYLELSWDQQPSKLEFMDRPVDTSGIVTDLTINYYQIGLVYNWSDTRRQPFIGMTFGMAHWVTSGPWEDETGFVFTPIFGYQGWVSQYFGFRGQAKVMISNMPAGEIFKNTSTGVGFQHYKNTWATQVSLSVALTVGI
jgi:hypothetical protein